MAIIGGRHRWTLEGCVAPGAGGCGVAQQLPPQDQRFPGAVCLPGAETLCGGVRAVTPEQKRLADRIIKLLALANSTTFEAEAKTARSMAEELMRVHNVSIDPGKPAQDAMGVREYVPFAKGMRWEGIIAGALATLCSCEVFFDHRVLDHYTLVGVIGNLDVLDYMLREVNRQRIAAWLKYKGAAGEDSFNKFCYGFAQGLQGRIAELELPSDRERLILWYETNVLHKPVLTHDLSSGRASSEAGLAAGEGASLHRGALGQPHKRIGHIKRLR